MRLLLLVFVALVAAQCTLDSVPGPYLGVPVPADAPGYAAWLANASAWATLSRTAQAYDGVKSAIYSLPGVAWTAAAPLQVHVPVHDIRVAPAAGTRRNFTLSAWLDGIVELVGDVDTVVLWPASLPALGLDWRSHLALARELPGGGGAGGEGGGAGPLAFMAAELLERTPPVHLLLGLLPWDTSTVDDAPYRNVTLTCEVAAEFSWNTSASGLHLRDTAFAPASCSSYNGSQGSSLLALQTDGALAYSSDASAPAAIGYTLATMSEPVARAGVLQSPCSTAESHVGGAAVTDVSAYKWLERRHRPIFGNLLAPDRAASALAALVNGGGLAITDNAFGFAVPLTAADAALVRRVAAILRFAALLTRSAEPAAAAGNATAIPWAPLRPSGSASLAVAEFWAPCPASMSAIAGNCSLLTFANQGVESLEAVAVDAAAAAARSGGADAQWWDLYSGVPVNATGAPGTTTSGFLATIGPGGALTVTLEAGGAGAVLVTPAGEPPAPLLAFLTSVIRTSTQPLAQLDRTWRPVQQVAAEPAPSRPQSAPPPGMVLIPGAIGYAFSATGVLPEPLTRADAWAGAGLDVQFPWEPAPAVTHAAALDLAPYFMDANLTTNADFDVFVVATGFNATTPPATDATNFLRHWLDLGNGTRSYNASDALRPVTWVARTDAAAYCAWRGARLPTDVEWQAAAQAVAGAGPSGSDYRRFPWGNATCAETPGACPPVSGSADALPPLISSYPKGASALGLQDMLGAVWQITDQFADGVNVAALLRGGSSFQAEDAGATAGGFAPRYLAAAADLTQHVRMPLVDESSLRSAFVGFRCVVDTPSSAAARSRSFGAASW